MIDLIKLRQKGFNDETIRILIDTNKLQTNSRDKVVYYDNQKLKNVRDGFYIRIETGKPPIVKLECSLHKYWNWLKTGKQVNYNCFNFPDVLQAVSLLSQKTGLPLNDFKVTYYEIGLNLNVSKDCRAYLDKMQTIGAPENKKNLYVNPRYKDRRLIITEFYEEARKVFKAYDKCFEMKRKGRTDLPEHPNILRIETIQKRVENTTLADLLNPVMVSKLIDMFYKDWRTVQFDRNIIAPLGTHQSRIDICEKILKDGKENVLNEARKQHKNSGLTDKQFRNIREFIQNEWETFKHSIKIIQSDEEKEFRELLTDRIEFINN